MLKLVPFNSKWINHEKIDVHAIYRRPRYKEDEYGEKYRELDPKTHLPTWDVTGHLPVKAHNVWLNKGYQYITLHSRNDLQVAAMHGTLLDAEGNATADWRQYDQHQTGGPWNYKKYMDGQTATNTLDADQLEADVNRFGSDAVEAIRRSTDKAFALPDYLKGRAAGWTPPAKVAEEPVATTMTVGKAKVKE